MSSSANVQSIQALQDLRAALIRFESAAEVSLQAAGMEIERTESWLTERESQWRSRVRSLEGEVEQALSSLNRCLHSGHTDREGRYHPPDCSAEQRDFRSAKRRFEEAEAALARVVKARYHVQQAVAQYQQRVSNFRSHLATDLPKATGMLERGVSHLQAYTAQGWASMLSEMASAFPISSSIDLRGGKEISGSGYEGNRSSVEGGGVERG